MMLYVPFSVLGSLKMGATRRKGSRMGDALGGRILLTCLYSPALWLLNVVEFLACFYGIGGEIGTSSVEPGAW